MTPEQLVREAMMILAEHPPADKCTTEECTICSMRDCPDQEALHYHHDGCPVCHFAMMPAEEARYREQMLKTCCAGLVADPLGAAKELVDLRFAAAKHKSVVMDLHDLVIDLRHKLALATSTDGAAIAWLQAADECGQQAYSNERELSQVNLFGAAELRMMEKLFRERAVEVGYNVRSTETGRWKA